MKLMTKTLAKTIPALGSTKQADDPIIRAKFFNPCGGQTWYVMEFDGEDTLYTVVVGMGGDGPEFGYTSLSELGSVRNRLGLGIERDLYFTPVPVSTVLGGVGVWE